DAEALNWLSDPAKTLEEVIGYASALPVAGMRRLYRAVRGTDGMHYFYLQAPPGLALFFAAPPSGKEVRLENSFVLYVWTQKGDGMVPIHACCLPDGTDVFLDPDLRKLGRFVNEKSKALGIQPRVYQSAFYLYPKEKPPAA